MPPVLRTLDLRLITPRLTLAPLGPADLDDLWPTVSDPTFPRYMTWLAHRTPDDTETWLAIAAKDLATGRGVTWTVREGGVFVGCVGLHGLAYQWRAWRIDRAEVGYWMVPAHHGRGLCTEATRAVMGFGFGAAQLHKLTIGCLEPNLASRRVIEKLGFRFVGVEREHWGRDHEWIDHRAYEMTVGEYGAMIAG